MRQKMPDFELTDEDWKIIDARLEAARTGDIASNDEVEAVFRKLHALRNKTALEGISQKEL